MLDALGRTAESRDAKGAIALTAYDDLDRPTHAWARDKTGEPITLRGKIEYGTEAAKNNVLKPVIT